MDFCVYQLFVYNLQHIISSVVLCLPAYRSPAYIKKQVLCYMDEGELPEFVNGDCDISTKHNVRED
jgi:hypothetical protein